MTETQAEPVKLNILVAIPYCKPDVVDMVRTIPSGRFYLDSGAFTSWKVGKEITLDQYCQFIGRLPVQPWRYFTLDAIGDSVRTRQNFDELKRRGLNPVPIFTRGERLEELEYYYSQSDCVALGGLVGTRGNKGFVKGLMERIGSRRTHWLGFTQGDFMTHYRPYTCDSSGWSGAFRYGHIQLYCGRGKWISLKKQDFVSKPSPEVMRVFAQYEEDPRRLAFAGEWKCSGSGKYLLETLPCKAWVKYAIEVEQTFGTKLFLACSTAYQVQFMRDAWNFWAPRLLQAS